jgi:hypothetical protein
MWAKSLKNPLRARMWGGFQASGFWQVFKVHLTNTKSGKNTQNSALSAVSAVNSDTLGRP